ncbi:MAG: SDR family NAD(P)-dependent oxidoreductase [Pseudomonadota bacterium]
MKGERIWVIGASSGIGAALAKALAGKGAKVWISARSEDDLKRVAEEDPDRIIPLPLDITNRENVDAAMSEIDKDGPIDRVVTSAALWVETNWDDLHEGGFRPTIEVNILGTINVISAASRAMDQQGCGHIAVLSSVAGFRGLPRAAAYGSSKAALTHLCESLRFMLEPRGIRLQVIHPGFVDTPATQKNDFDMPYLISSDEAADRIIEGLQKKQFEITFPKRFTFQLKFLRILPYAVYFWLVGRITKGGGNADETAG